MPIAGIRGQRKRKNLKNGEGVIDMKRLWFRITHRLMIEKYEGRWRVAIKERGAWCYTPERFITRAGAERHKADIIKRGYV